MNRLIKRYGNRKLYDTKTSRYITLDGIADLVRAGEDVAILDNDTGEDLTAVTFAQIIFEQEKRQNGMLGLPVLRRLIQLGGETVQDLLSSVDRGREALEKGMRQLAQSAGVQPPPGRPPDNSGRSLLNDLLEVPQKQIEQLQHRIDAQVRASIERFTTHPAIQNELSRIEKSVRSLERQLSRLRVRQQRPTPSSRTKPPKEPKARPPRES